MAAILNRRVLVLNQSYEPLMVIGAKRALILILSDKVDSLADYREKINSAYLSIPLPSVIRLKEYARIRRKEIVLSRKNILKRDNHTCQYCGNSNGQLTIDHIIPKHKGGKDTWKNLVTSCNKCNRKKGNLSIDELNMRLMKKPVKPHYLLYLQRYAYNDYVNWRPYLFMKEKN